MRSEYFVHDCRNQKIGDVIVEIGFVDELDGELILMDDGEVICLDQHISPAFKGSEIVDLISKCLGAVCDIGSDFKLKNSSEKVCMDSKPDIGSLGMKIKKI